MKICIVFLFFLPFTAIYAQDQNAQIDSLAKAFVCDSCPNLEEFTKTLVLPYKSEEDKARAIFAWIGTHIRYDFVKFEKGSGFEIRASSEAEMERKLAVYRDETMPNMTFKSKKGICEDYSRLYKKMCDFADVECLVITGLAKHISKRIRGLDHAWNAVKIKDKWWLLDATWGAGYVENETFHRAYSPGFFMVEPRLFILNHLPTDDKWQLLSEPLTKQKFKKQPWLNYGQRVFPIEDAKPLDKAIAKQGNTIQVFIKFKKKPPFLMVHTSDHKPIPYQESEQDGYTVLTLMPTDNDEILIYGNKSRQGQFIGLAKFYID